MEFTLAILFAVAEDRAAMLVLRDIVVWLFFDTIWLEREAETRAQVRFTLLRLRVVVDESVATLLLSVDIVSLFADTI